MQFFLNFYFFHYFWPPPIKIHFKFASRIFENLKKKLFNFNLIFTFILNYEHMLGVTSFGVTS